MEKLEILSIIITLFGYYFCQRKILVIVTKYFFYKRMTLIIYQNICLMFETLDSYVLKFKSCVFIENSSTRKIPDFILSTT